MDKIEKPAYLKDDHLFYLDGLRKSGITNMHGATPYLLEAFDGLTKIKARMILSYWMKTYSERHKDE